jgi:predicted XRE-type DNA-binding protein
VAEDALTQIAIRARGDAWRVVYALQLADAIWIIPAFQKKAKSGIATPKHEIDLGEREIEAPERAIAMTSDDDMELVHGSGNIFRDLGRPNPEARQLKAILAGQVLKVLDESGLSTRKAQELTGIDHGDFSRVRRAKLDRFTVERMIAMLEGLGQEVEVSVDVHPRRPVAASAQPGA